MKNYSINSCCLTKYFGSLILFSLDHLATSLLETLYLDRFTVKFFSSTILATILAFNKVRMEKSYTQMSVKGYK